MDKEVKEGKTEDLKKEIETKNEEVIKLGPPLSCIKGGHYLVVDGMEMGMRRVRCDRCPVGFYITGEDELRDGHVYTKGKLII